MNSPSPSQSGQEDCSKFPWPDLEAVCDVFSEGRLVTPEIAAQVEKGFFQDPAEKRWTCYRRNYFSVGCSYTLNPFANGGNLFVKRGTNQELVKAIGVRISAAVDGANGKTIELVQHTPKRDAGPKMKVKPVRMLPKPSNARTDAQVYPSGSYAPQMVAYHQTGHVPAPNLPLQCVVEPETSPEPSGSAAQSSSSSPYGQPQPANHGTVTQYTFERIQFKCATANNGKRRASQQYFHLIAELLVDIRKEGAEDAAWQTIAKRTSDKIVVRGRSPSHYQNEGAGGNNGRVNTGAHGRYSNAGVSSNIAYGPMGGSSLRSPVSGHSSAGASMGFASMGYGPNISFRPQSQYPVHESSGESASSPESVNNGDAFDADHSSNTMMSHSDRTGIHDMDGYSYHPSPIYDSIHHHHLPAPKIEGHPRISTDPRQHAFKADFPEGTAGPQWHLHGPFGRYQGFENSKNVFPDVAGGAGSYS
jgi:meiosis-specific transcription factor NDT80